MFTYNCFSAGWCQMWLQIGASQLLFGDRQHMLCVHTQQTCCHCVHNIVSQKPIKSAMAMFVQHYTRSLSVTWATPRTVARTHAASYSTAHNIFVDVCGVGRGVAGLHSRVSWSYRQAVTNLAVHHKQKNGWQSYSHQPLTKKKNSQHDFVSSTFLFSEMKCVQKCGCPCTVPTHSVLYSLCVSSVPREPRRPKMKKFFADSHITTVEIINLWWLWEQQLFHFYTHNNTFFLGKGLCFRARSISPESAG